MMARIREELRKQGVTRGFLWGLSGVLVLLVAVLTWMGISAAAELDRNHVPRNLMFWKVDPPVGAPRSLIPYDPMRVPTARQPDGVVVSRMSDGSVVSLKYQWVEKPTLRLVRHEVAEGDDRGKAEADSQAGADQLTAEGTGKAEPYQAKGYQPSCQSPKNQGDSDLCAQWLAAREAAFTNDIGRSGLVLQWLNLIVTLLVGAMTAIGLLVAAQATRLAAEAMHTANRVVRGQVISVIRASGNASARRVQGRFENIGESPAEVVGYKWFAGASVDVAEAQIATATLDLDSVYLAAGEKDFCRNLDDEPAIAVVIDYTDMLGGRWRCWAVFERMAGGKYLRRKHGEDRRA